MEWKYRIAVNGKYLKIVLQYTTWTNCYGLHSLVILNFDIFIFTFTLQVLNKKIYQSVPNLELF